MGHGLGAVDEDEGAGRVGHSVISRDRVDRTEGVADMGEGHELRLEPEEDLEDIEAEDAVIGDRDELQVAVLLLDQELPRDEVGVVLHLGQDDDVTPADVLPAPQYATRLIASVALRVKTISWRSGALMNRADALSGRLVRGGGALADLVDAAVDVGVVVAVEVSRPR